MRERSLNSIDTEESGADADGDAPLFLSSPRRHLKSVLPITAFQNNETEFQTAYYFELRKGEEMRDQETHHNCCSSLSSDAS